MIKKPEQEILDCMTIVYIHGASATSESFTRIREHLPKRDLCIDYHSSDGFDTNLKKMIELLDSVEKVFFVAHSLGGIYAIHLADKFPNKVLGAVTLSTPYGGSREADFAKYFLPFSQLMRDIGTMSRPMSSIQNLRYPRHRWTNIVTTQGASPWINQDNDGVVTLESMRAVQDMELVEVALNHYEVVISDKTIAIIKDRLARTPLGP
jgi:pimeloyl-ACP methyl ester carboxylesterase